MTLGYSLALRTTRANDVIAAVGNGAILTIYGGVRPATGGPITSPLAQWTLGSPWAPTTSSPVISPNIPPSTVAIGSDTATWFRITKSDGTTQVIDGSVGTSGADLNLTEVVIGVGMIIGIVSWAITGGNP